MRILRPFTLLLLINFSCFYATHSKNKCISIPFNISKCTPNRIEYEEPPDLVIVDEQNINDSLDTLNIHLPVRRKNIFNKLREMQLLPLRLNEAPITYLIKLLGFFISEGRLFVNKDFEPRISVCARNEILTQVRNDLSSLGVPASLTVAIRPFRQTETFHSLTDTSTSYTLHIGANAAVVLFHALGLPLGKRGEQKLEVPKWILEKATKWQQGLFLSAYLGCRMATPTAKTKYHFNGVFIQQSQRTPFFEYGIAFQEQLRNLLNSFGIESSDVAHFDDHTTPNTVRIRFKIKENDENLIRLFSTFSFEYHPEKQMYANLANCYLRYKTLFVAENPLIHLTDFPTWDEFLAEQITA